MNDWWAFSSRSLVSLSAPLPATANSNSKIHFAETREINCGRMQISAIRQRHRGDSLYACRVKTTPLWHTIVNTSDQRRDTVIGDRDLATSNKWFRLVKMLACVSHGCFHVMRVKYYLVNGSILSLVRRIGLFEGLFYSKFIILYIAVVMIEVLEISCAWVVSISIF